VQFFLLPFIFLCFSVLWLWSNVGKCSYKLVIDWKIVLTRFKKILAPEQRTTWTCSSSLEYFVSFNFIQMCLLWRVLNNFVTSILTNFVFLEESLQWLIWVIRLFHQHFTSSFLRQYSWNKKLQSKTVTREKLCKTHLHKKVESKMLMKLIPALLLSFFTFYHLKANF